MDLKHCNLERIEHRKEKKDNDGYETKSACELVVGIQGKDMRKYLQSMCVLRGSHGF